MSNRSLLKPTSYSSDDAGAFRTSSSQIPFEQLSTLADRLCHLPGKKLNTGAHFNLFDYETAQRTYDMWTDLTSKAPFSSIMYQFHHYGKLASVPVTATAFGHRSSDKTAVIYAVWTDDNFTAEAQGYAERLKTCVSSSSTESARQSLGYSCFADMYNRLSDNDENARKIFGENYKRLQENTYTESTSSTTVSSSLYSDTGDYDATMKLKDIHRTSTFAWSPFSSLPLLATGTVAGALDASFSNDSQLEIWDPDFINKTDFDLGSEGKPGPKGFVTTSSRFNRLAWGNVNEARPKGVIAAGMENGELGLWDPEKIVQSAEPAQALILRNTEHSGPIRGLDFNPIQTNLLATGATEGEIYIWDLKSSDPSKPHAPGNRSTKLDEITALAWNCLVPHVLGTSSSSGYTVVWDLRGKKEVVALAYGGGAGTMGGGSTGSALAAGGRRGMSDVAWHPNNATRLVTSSEDDSSPVIMVWDLRNARAPEKILSGHDKGVLSLSWCRQDADLLLSCGKDNRALCWNPQTSEMIGELPSSNNWAFQVQWCPRNPDLLATASFDGTIGIHSLQSTNETEVVPSTPQTDGADIFDTSNIGNDSARQKTLSLKQPPKWLRRPVSSTFGFGGQLVSVSNTTSAHSGHQTGVVHMRKIVTEPLIVQRAKALQEAADAQKLGEFAQAKSTESAGESALEGWKALLSLFRANTRDELVTLLGFSKEEIAASVADAIKKLKSSGSMAAPATNVIPPESQESDVTENSKPYEPVVSFAEPEREETPEPLSEPAEGPSTDGNMEATPSEMSAGATSDATKGRDLESTATEPSLFGDDIAVGTPQGDANADFFTSMGAVRSALPGHVLVPHHSYAADSSVAATIGSRPSSAASDTLKTTTFKIYPNEESEIDRLLTKSLVLGDFESAVSLCLSVERYADAILLAVKGGSELLQRTQTAYFTRQTTSLPYLRLYQSIVSNDLTDIVQNADLKEWQEIFVILCTFARQDEFSHLAKQLGQRLEFQGKVAKAAAGGGQEDSVREYRKNATLCYLAAGKLEQVVSIWIEEMKEDEAAYAQGEEGEKAMGVSRYTAHAVALQTFVEKVAVFRSATNYTDPDLTANTSSSSEDVAGVRSYKLAALYDRYYEYADLLAAQGLLKEAVQYIGMTPADYKGTKGGVDIDFDIARERVLLAANMAAGKISTSRDILQPKAPQPSQQQTPVPAYGTNAAHAPPAPSVYSQAPTQAVAPTTKPSPYEAMYAPPNGSTAPAPGGAARPHDPYAPVGGVTAPSQQHSQQGPYRQQQPTVAPYGGSYAPPAGGYGQPHYGGPQNAYGTGAGGSLVPPAGPTMAPPPRAPPKRTDEGWNDAPVLDAALSRKSTPSINAGPKAAITSPFPNSTSPSSPIAPYGTQQQQQQQSSLPPPPPPRGSHFGPGGQQQVPPPPRGGSAMAANRPPPPPSGQQGPYPPPAGRGGPPPAQMPGQGSNPPPFVRPPSGAAGAPPGVTYPVRAMSPRVAGGLAGTQDRAMSPLAQGGARPPPPPGAQGQYAPPPGQQPTQQQQQQQRGPQAGMLPPRGPTGTPPVRGPPPQGAAPGQGPYAAPQQPRGHPPPPGQGQGQGGYAPPPGASLRGPPSPGQQQSPQRQHVQSPAGGPAPGPPKPAPPPVTTSKYPPGDRSHIPDESKRSYEILSSALATLKQTTPPQQKRMVDDTERRLNTLFDALNCETLSTSVSEKLHGLTNAMERRDQQAALQIHLEMLTTATTSDDIALWASGVKLLIMRLQ
ncbi:protein transport protein S31 [Tulasnella sp. 331]|nr:protein transport protein S31 [Tulasnella sp. 331]